MKYQLLKNLENYKKGILKGLHGCLGFDFEADLIIFEVAGNYTVNSILKQAAAAGVDPVNYQIALLTRPASGYYSDRYTAFIIDGAKFENDINHCGYSNNCFVSLNTYFRKSDINEARKNALHTVIICQKRDLMQAPRRNNPGPDLMQRFMFKEAHYTRYYNSDKKYLSSLDIIPAAGNGYKYEYKPENRSDSINIDDFIDKSGYIVNIRRADLKRRAAAIKAAKDQAAYNATNNEAALAELKSQIENKKAAIISELQAADNSEAIYDIAKKLNHFHGLSDIYSDFERLQAADHDKKIPSIETFNKRYESIQDALKKI